MGRPVTVSVSVAVTVTGGGVVGGAGAGAGVAGVGETGMVAVVEEDPLPQPLAIRRMTATRGRRIITNLRKKSANG